MIFMAINIFIGCGRGDLGGVAAEQRKGQAEIRKNMDYDGDGGTAASKRVPLIGQVRQMMHLRKAGHLVRVDEYLEERVAPRNPLLHQIRTGTDRARGESYRLCNSACAAAGSLAAC